MRGDLSRPSGWARARSAVALAAVAALAGTMAVVGVAPTAPAGAAEPREWASISAGFSFSCGVTTAGSGYCWGQDTFGQLGNGPATASQASPSPVVTPAGVLWASIEVGTNHACGVTTTGAAYCWGNNGDRQLGKGNVFGNEAAPVAVAGPPGVTWASISAGASHSCAVTTTGAGYCWGTDLSGRLGNGAATTGTQHSPSPVETPAGVAWATIDAGGTHTCAVDTAGAVGGGTGYCWGADFGGQLGAGDTAEDQASPQVVSSRDGTGWTSIVAGFVHTCGISGMGLGYCWGAEDVDGRLGDGPALTGSRFIPSPLDVASGVTWSSIAAGNQHSCATTTAGAAHCWGDDTNGKLGDGATAGAQASPSPVAAPASGTWEAISAGTAHSCALASTGLASCWGNDGVGEVGNGGASGDQPAPSRVGADQTVTFGALADRPVSDGSLTVGAAATSELPVTFTSTTTGVCTVEGTTVALVAEGACTIRATQVGDALWLAAPPAEQTFTVTAPVNVDPVAHAGDDRVVNAGDTVTLDGSGSTDDDGDTLTYAWTQSSGPAVTLSGAATASPTFTAPAAMATLVFSLTVDDGEGGSDTDTVTITVNQAPTADAGDDQDVDAGDTVTLDGTGSSDPDQGPLTYSWTQTAGPAVTLSGATTAQPTFTAPAGPASLTFSLTVADGAGGSDTDTVTITVNGSPTAAAGPDQVVNTGDTVTLSGTGSTDPDGDTLSYLWSQTGGPAVDLPGSQTATATFTAPTGPADLTFRLTVDDGEGGTDTDTVTITVNGQPTADAGDDQDVDPGDTVSLDATGSIDGDGDPITYSWTQTAGPTVALSGADGFQPTFTAPAGPATLTFELTVSDGKGGTDTDTVTITVNGLPTADAGDDAEAVEGTTVTLDATGSSDPDDDPLTYSWQQTVGDPVTLTGHETATPSFEVPTAPATVAFTVTVSDDRGGSDTDSVTIVARPRFTADEAWVDHTYQVLLDRPSDDPSRAYWVGRLAAGVTRVGVARRIGLSVEATRGEVLDERYDAWLDRPVDAGARAYWSEHLLAGRPMSVVELSILGSPELYAQAGGTDTAYVTVLYQRVLGRHPDAAGLAYFEDRLASGASRASVARSILESAESHTRRVRRSFSLILDRLPDVEELAAEVAVLRSTRDLRVVEYRLAARWVAQPGAST